MVRNVKERSSRTFLNNIIELLIPVYMCTVFIFSFNTDLNIYSKLIALLLIGFTGLYFLTKKTFVFDTFPRLLVSFWCFCLLTYFWAWEPDLVVEKCITLFQVVVLAYLVYNYLVKENKLNYFIGCLCFSTTFFAIYTVFYFGVEEYFAGLDDGIRMGEEIANVNTVGVYAAMAVLINLWYVFYKKRYWQLILVALCSVVALGSGSRKAIIAMVIGIAFMFVVTGDKKKRLKGLLLAILLLTILFFVFQLPIFSTINRRVELMFETFSGTHSGGSTDTRMKMIDIGISQFIKTPLGGIGIGNSVVLIKQEIGLSTYLHNNYAELLASVGIIGTIIYYLLYFIPLRHFLSSKKLKHPEVTLSIILVFVSLILHYGKVAFVDKMEYMFILFYFLVIKSVNSGNENEQNIKSN